MSRGRRPRAELLACGISYSCGSRWIRLVCRSCGSRLPRRFRARWTGFTASNDCCTGVEERFAGRSPCGIARGLKVCRRGGSTAVAFLSEEGVSFWCGCVLSLRRDAVPPSTLGRLARDGNCGVRGRMANIVSVAVLWELSRKWEGAQEWVMGLG